MRYGRMRLSFRLLLGLAFWLTGLSLCAHGAAGAQVLYQDDFESGVSGWSTSISESHPAFTRYLGRFDNSPNQTSRTFAVPAGSQSLVIAFDFYRFDSWDNTAQWGFDRFQIDISGSQIFSLPFAPAPPSLTGSNGTVSWQFTPVGPLSNQAYGTFTDQRYRVTITIANPPPSVTLTLRTAINQGGNDESGGFDNFRVEAFPASPDVSISKTSAPEAAGDFHIPGTNVIYTILVTSSGGALDAGTLRLTDILPPDVIMFTGNFAGSGAAVLFTDLSSPASGVICCTAAHLFYSDDAPAPLAYDHVPNGADDASVTALQVIPGGQVRQGVTSPVQLRFQFRVRIK